MTKWTNHARDLLASEGYDPDAFLDAAQLARIMCPLDPENSVSRIVLKDDVSAWVTGNKGDTITCYELGTHDNTWDGIWHLSKPEYYELRNPTWPSSATFRKAATQAARNAHANKLVKTVSAPDVPLGLVWASDKDGRLVMAEIVVKNPLTLRFQKDGSVTMTAKETGLTWKAIERPQEGFVQLWAKGKTHHYDFLRMSQAAKRLTPEENTFRARLAALSVGKESHTPPVTVRITPKAAPEPAEDEDSGEDEAPPFVYVPPVKREIPLEQQLDAVTCTMTDGSSKLMSRADADVHGAYLRRLHASGWRFGMPIPDNA